MNRLAGFLLLLGTLAAHPAMARAADLTVVLHGVRAAPGNLRASLYREPETFRKENKAVQLASLPATADEMKLVFRDVPAGRYAVMVYHDENADGRLNLRLGMFPTEGYGLSNNPHVFGPPKFADSAFDVTGADSRIEIKLNY